MLVTSGRLFIITCLAVILLGPFIVASCSFSVDHLSEHHCDSVGSDSHVLLEFRTTTVDTGNLFLWLCLSLANKFAGFVRRVYCCLQAFLRKVDQTPVCRVDTKTSYTLWSATQQFLLVP